nr:GHKL domain-containing protein [Acetatifactor aquisgranensis]
MFSVRNPVAEKVQATEGTGLSNVKAVADKYEGDFAVSCDAEKFQAVVML